MKATKKIWWLIIVLIIAAAAIITFKTEWNFVKKDLAKQPQQKSIVKPLLQDELKRMIIAASDSLYQLKFSSFVLNIDSGKGLIKDLQLTADSNIYKKLVAQHKAPNMRMNIHADSLRIDHFEFAKTNDGKQFVVNNVLIQNPSIHVDYYPQYNNNTRDTSSNSLLAAAVKKIMQLSVIKHMKMNNLSLVMLYHENKKIKTTALRHLDIAMDGMDIKQVKSKDSSHNNTLITVASYHLTTADKLYTILTRNMQINPEQNSAFIEKTIVQPAYSKASFFQHVSKANDRFYFEYTNMQLTGLDINKLLHHQQIKIRKMTAASSITDIYTDYALRKRKPPIRKHAFPHELLQQLAFDITIDTMLMHNGTLKYEMKTKKSDSIAVFEMKNIESKMINITNNPIAKLKNHFTVVTTSANVMDAANITTFYKFNLADKNGAFTITSELSPMNATTLNPLTKPLALVEIRSLDIQKMITTINADETAANGNIDLYYKNMKIAMLKKKDDDLKKRKLLSFVSNVFMADDNPKKNGKFKKGIIHIQRNATDSFFGYLWRATFDGMVTEMMGTKKIKLANE